MSRFHYTTQKALRQLLVTHIDNPSVIQRMARDSGLKHTNINWDKDAETLWQTVLDQVAGQKPATCQSLMQAVLKEAPGLEVPLRALLASAGLEVPAPLRLSSENGDIAVDERSTLASSREPNPGAAPHARGPDWSAGEGTPEPTPIRARRALLIGINAYTHPISALRYARNDAKMLASALGARGYDPVVTLPQASAEDAVSANDMRTGLSRVLAGATGDELLWLHFSGHGMRRKNVSYLLSSQAAVEHVEHEVSVDWLVAQARAAGIRRLVLTLDACQTGVALGRDTPDLEFEQAQNRLELTSEGYVILSGTTALQAAVEEEALAHGRFTGWLLEWIRQQSSSGPSLATVSSLGEFLGARALELYQRQGGFYQKPTLNFQGTGNLLLLR